MFAFLKTIFGKKFPHKDGLGNIEADKLPEEMPVQFSLELSRGRGMRLGSTSIYFGPFSSHYRISNGRDTQFGCYFQMDLDEMKALYAQLKVLGFDKIEMQDTMRLDYPSSSLSLTWDNFYIYKAESQTSTQKKNSKGDLYACMTLVESIAKEKASQHNYPITILLDEALQKQDSGFALYIEDLDSWSSTTPYYESSSGKPLPQVKLMPGTYVFKMYLHAPDSTFFNKKYKFSSYVNLSIMEKQSSVLHISSDGIRFLWKVVHQPL